jgi:hypothetical protein
MSDAAERSRVVLNNRLTFFDGALAGVASYSNLETRRAHEEDSHTHAAPLPPRAFLLFRFADKKMLGPHTPAFDRRPSRADR